jgi:hypothetical protein
LREAADQGFTGPRALQDDPDFASLAGDEGFSRLMAEATGE